MKKTPADRPMSTLARPICLFYRDYSVNLSASHIPLSLPDDGTEVNQ
jgi:hypothetical protein